MKTLVVGIGALGTIFSCLLKEQGHEVVGVDSPPVVESIRKQGVRVTGIWGDHAAMLDEVTEGIEQIQRRDFDLIILTVKSFDTGLATAQIAGVVGPDTKVLLTQNGYGNYEAAAKNIPEGPVDPGEGDIWSGNL